MDTQEKENANNIIVQETNEEKTDLENAVEITSEITVQSPENTEEKAICAEPPHEDKKKTQNLTRIAFFVFLAIMLIAVILFTFIVIIPRIRYASAQKAFSSQNYNVACEKFEALKDYKDAPEMAVLAGKAYHYSLGKQAFDSGDYDTAYDEYLLAEDYEDAEKMAAESILAGHYSNGVQAIAQGSYEEAIDRFQKADRYLDAPEKLAEANDLQGSKMFDNKEYIAAAAYFSASGNSQMRIQCGEQLVSTGKFENAIEILQDYEEPNAVSYRNYANAMLCAQQEDYENAIIYIRNAGEVLDSKAKESEYIFCLGEWCLQEGYLNKAKNLYKLLPEGYSRNGTSAEERIELLNKNQKFCDLVGKWSTTKCKYKVQADSTTSSYYYYWYQDALKIGSVTVRCPYKDGKFSVVGTATYPTYTNFSQYSSRLKTEMLSLSFDASGLTSIPKTIGSNKHTTLQFNGKQFTLKYKYINDYSNVGWHYTFTCNSTYGKRTMLDADT